MKPLFAVAAELEKFLIAHRWQYCFIGGIALQRWGQPRLTVDVDLTLLTGFGGEERYVDELLAAYSPRLPDARNFALKNRVLLLKSAEGIAINIALGAIPFEIEAVNRASRFEFLPGLSLLTCSAEDSVIFKAFAGRPQDWADIERQLAPLCLLKDAPDIMPCLQQCRDHLT
jgi:hypothetical protein